MIGQGCYKSCTSSVGSRRASRDVVYIDGPRFLVGAQSENDAPISNAPPIRAFITAAQHSDIAGARIILHLKERSVYPPALSGRDSTTRSALLLRRTSHFMLQVVK